MIGIRFGVSIETSPELVVPRLAGAAVARGKVNCVICPATGLRQNPVVEASIALAIDGIAIVVARLSTDFLPDLQLKGQVLAYCRSIRDNLINIDREDLRFKAEGVFEWQLFRVDA